jgi:hypothetical protein
MLEYVKRAVWLPFCRGLEAVLEDLFDFSMLDVYVVAVLDVEAERVLESHHPRYQRHCGSVRTTETLN